MTGQSRLRLPLRSAKVDWSATRERKRNEAAELPGYIYSLYSLAMIDPVLAANQCLRAHQLGYVLILELRRAPSLRMLDEPATDRDTAAAAAAAAAAAEVGLRRSRDAVVNDDPGRARRQPTVWRLPRHLAFLLPLGETAKRQLQ